MSRASSRSLVLMNATLWHPSRMRNPHSVLLEDLSRRQAEGLYLLLTSQGVEASVAGLSPRGRQQLLTAQSEAGRAARIIADEYPNGIPNFEPRPKRQQRNTLPWFGRGSWMVFVIMAVCVGFHLVVHQGFGPSARSRMIEFGAIQSSAIRSGEIWRFLSAVLLHFDASHLLSNMGTMLFLGPPLARSLGGPRLLVVFAVAGAAANVASYFLHPIAGLKAGASGGIAAFLGAMGGQTLQRPPASRRLQPWVILGALAAIYAMMIGFGPGRDNYAHVFGVLFGLALGRAMPSLPDVPKECEEHGATAEADESSKISRGGVL